MHTLSLPSSNLLLRVNLQAYCLIQGINIFIVRVLSAFQILHICTHALLWKQITCANSTALFVSDSSHSPLADSQGTLMVIAEFLLKLPRFNCVPLSAHDSAWHTETFRKMLVKGEVKYKHFGSGLTESSAN